MISFADHVSGVFGSAEEYDLSLRSRHLPDVRRQNVRMSHLQENCGETNLTILDELLFFLPTETMIIYSKVMFADLELKVERQEKLVLLAAALRGSF